MGKLFISSLFRYPYISIVSSILQANLGCRIENRIYHENKSQIKYYSKTLKTQTIASGIIFFIVSKGPSPILAIL